MPIKFVKGNWGDKPNILINRPKAIATAKLVAGPAKATFNEPHFWSLKLCGFMGMGFAQPKTGPCPAVAISKSRGSIKEPKRSRCFKGFKVSLPAYFAVKSPKDKATYPWANSCTTTDKSKTIKEKIKIAGSILYYNSRYCKN